MPDRPHAADRRPTFSVIIPVHNEASYLPEALPELYAELEQVPAEVTVLLVENGSTDDTVATAKRLAHRFPGLALLELPVADYGAAMRAGFLETDGDWAINFDIDFFSAGFLLRVLDLAETADVVVASKRAPGSEDRRSRLRRLATWGFNLLLRVVLRSRVSDTHGMKAVRRRVVDAVAPQVVSTQDLFDTELVIRAERAGYRIVEVPVRVEERRQARSSLWRRVPRTLRGMFRIRRLLSRADPPSG
jgi:glycosyltransferase involved in cell wall biosynthesis